MINAEDIIVFLIDSAIENSRLGGGGAEEIKLDRRSTTGDSIFILKEHDSCREAQRWGKQILVIKFGWRKLRTFLSQCL